MLSFREHKELLFLLEMPYVTLSDNQSVDFEAEKAVIDPTFKKFICDLFEIKEKVNVIENKDKQIEWFSFLKSKTIEDKIKTNVWEEIKHVLLQIKEKISEPDPKKKEISYETITLKKNSKININGKVFNGSVINEIYLKHLIDLFNENKNKSSYGEYNLEFRTKQINADLKEAAINYLLKEDGISSFSNQIKHNFFSKIKFLGPEEVEEED